MINFFFFLILDTQYIVSYDEFLNIFITFDDLWKKYMRYSMSICRLTDFYIEYNKQDIHFITNSHRHYIVDSIVCVYISMALLLCIYASDDVFYIFWTHCAQAQVCRRDTKAIIRSKYWKTILYIVYTCSR